MKKTCFITLGLIMLVFFDVHAKETLTWQAIHWPPFQILEGVDKGQGKFETEYDTMLDQVKRKPEYLKIMDASRYALSSAAIELLIMRFWETLFHVSGKNWSP